MTFLLTFLLRPREAVSRLRHHPRWAAVFAFLCAAAIALMGMDHPFSVRETLHMLPPSLSPGDLSRVRELLDRELALRILTLPLRLLIGWGAVAVLLRLAFAQSRQSRFIHYFALEVHAESLPLLAQVPPLVAQLLGVAGRDHALDFLSLALFIDPGGDFLLCSLLRSVNLFTLWYLVLLTEGSAVLSESRRRAAVLPVTGVWLLTLGFQLGVTAYLHATLHLPR